MESASGERKRGVGADSASEDRFGDPPEMSATARAESSGP